MRRLSRRKVSTKLAILYRANSSSNIQISGKASRNDNPIWFTPAIALMAQVDGNILEINLTGLGMACSGQMVPEI